MSTSREAWGITCPRCEARSIFGAGNGIPAGFFIDEPRQVPIERDRSAVADRVRPQSRHSASNNAPPYHLVLPFASHVKIDRYSRHQTMVCFHEGSPGGDIDD